MKRTVLLTVLSLIFISTTGFVIFSSGIYNVTGSSGEGTCANCHSGGAAATNITISAFPAFTANQYVPGQTYTVSITITNSNAVKFGFDAEILNAQDNNAGMITTGLSGVQLTTASEGPRINAYHSAPKPGAGTATFQFVWVAPLSGMATLYVAVNAIGGSDFGAPANTTLALTAATNSIANNSEYDEISNLSVFPNPANDEINVHYYLDENEPIKATLQDLKGNDVFVVFEGKCMPGPQHIKTNLPAGLAKGFYILKLKGKTEKVNLVLVQ